MRKSYLFYQGIRLQIADKNYSFWGKKLDSAYIAQQSEYIEAQSFSAAALHFINSLQSVLSDCPLGFLYRFLAWFSDWDEFIYSDNDVVALCNWEYLFDYLNDGYDLVHADEEYTTNGKYNYNDPKSIQDLFGEQALESAITAGHIVVKKSNKMQVDIEKAVSWFKQHPDVPKKHDQSLLHVASLLGGWKILNLCKPPHNWLSSWAGDYKNALAIIQAIQYNEPKRNISHLHYSGSVPAGNNAIEDLLLSNLSTAQRLQRLLRVIIKFRSGFAFIQDKQQRIMRRLKSLTK